MRVLLTGGTGFVGRRLVPEIVRQHDVTCLVRTPLAAANLGAVETIVTDLAATTFTERLPADIDVVVHLAQAYLPFPERASDLFGVNAVSTQLLADYARRTRVSRFVLASSGSVYRPAKEPLDENAPTIPPGYHPTTKLIAEMILGQYRPYFGTAVLRLFAPYGPGQVDRLIPRMFEAIRAGAPITLSRGGEPRINPIHVDDLVRIVAQAIDDTRSYTVNVAGPEAVSIRELAETIGGLIGRRPTFASQDAAIAGDFVADTSLMHELFHVGELVPVRRGLQSLLPHAVPPAH